jgi:hypothetical protein
MEIDIVGEDPVTQSIIERLLLEYRKDITIKNRLPARGGQIKNLAPIYNKLGTPVFLLTDLDQYHCAPSLISDWFGKQAIASPFLFRIAHEEAETWLMADREGFSKWLGVKADLIPPVKAVDRKKTIHEIICPIKPSLHMMTKIACHSTKKDLKAALTPVKGASKGPGYNMVLTPFVHNSWNIENARTNSYSLNKTIDRLIAFNP